MAPRRFFVGGNFKMNGDMDGLTKLVKQFNDAELDPRTEVVIAPPAIYIIPLREHCTKNIEVAAQNAHALPSGAYTGEVSINQLKDIHLKWVILGHSERRTLFHESSEVVAEKTAAAIKLGIQVILCVGENLEQREKDETKAVVTSQLDAVNAKIGKQDWKHVVIAYEPVWAIGTGKVATPEVAQQTHADIRAWLKSNVSDDAAESTRIIYGGSVAAKNCVELGKKADIDGFLVGGASLKPEFVDIINAVKAKL